ncbi:hypothetical protein AU467_25675 [Mesorhizobium loti]|uniref:Uncharacterized protein n=1 Tax=Rhizobium loti TaxID=381 RepID=A0A101KR81_RHILI|nr:hypothetical protein AU467_25675 [Mesorhizobium loti]
MTTARGLGQPGGTATGVRRKAGRATAAVALEDARRAGLLDGDKTEHLSFRAPKALVEAAKRESGIESPTDLGILALATLAQPDPVASFLARTQGKLGSGHKLEF